MLDFAIFANPILGLLLQHFHLISLLYSTDFVAKSAKSLYRSMTRVTNYNVTSDIINIVKLTHIKQVLSTFKTLLIIH